jgi:hypothetical protein
VDYEGSTPSQQNSSDSTTLHYRLQQARRRANRLAIGAIMMVTIMLLTDLHPFVEPLPVPERYYVIAGEDATIQDLADRSLGPVAMVDEEGTVFQLAQDLVIDETGRLTIEDCILWIHDNVIALTTAMVGVILVAMAIGVIIAAGILMNYGGEIPS